MKRLLTAVILSAALTAPAQASWIDDLTTLLHAASDTPGANIRVSHCGDVKKSSIAIGWKRVYPNVSFSIHLDSSTRTATVQQVWQKTLMYRSIKFVCHHIGPYGFINDGLIK